MVGESNPEKLDQVIDSEKWHELADQSIFEAQAVGRPVSVLFIDINNFKFINDELGHREGDQVIADYKELVSGVTSKLRMDDSEGEADIVGRVGGDEIAILAFTDDNGAQIIIQRLREAFSSYIDEPTRAKLKALHVGMAVGSSSYNPLDPPEKDLSSKLYREADAAMYQDKVTQKHGRLPEVTPNILEAMTSIDHQLEEIGIAPNEFLDFHRKCFGREVTLQ